MTGLVPVETAVDLQVLRMQLCFVYLAKGQKEPAPDAIGPSLEYIAADMPAKVTLQMIDPKTGNIEAVDRQLQLTLKRPTVTNTVAVTLAGGTTPNLAQHICSTVQTAPGTYVAMSEDGLMQASLNIKILPHAPTNLLIRTPANLTVKMGQKFNLGFDVVDNRGVVYSDSSSLKMLLQTSDGSIEFDPPPDDEDGTFEIHQNSPDSQMGLFCLQTAIIGRLPANKKVNLTVILQGRQAIKRSIVAQLEAGEATRFVFSDARSSRTLGADAQFEYTSGEELGLRLLAVDDSGGCLMNVCSLQASLEISNLVCASSLGDR